MDQLGLQRSDQLRELYESLLLGEARAQAKRPTAALSPEDLTDAEWYFLVCMSFVFNTDQGYLSDLQRTRFVFYFDFWLMVGIFYICEVEFERSSMLYHSSLAESSHYFYQKVW